MFRYVITLGDSHVYERCLVDCRACGVWGITGLGSRGVREGVNLVALP